jgi:hypothetical protein
MGGRYIPEKVDALAVFEAEVPRLRRRGTRLVGLCPLHREKTPSFTISLTNNLYFCFGCGVGGDAMDLVMRLHHLSFREAAKSLGAWSELNPAERAKFDRELSQRRREREKADRQRRAEHAHLLFIRSRLLLFESWYQQVAAHLAANRDCELLWDFMCVCSEFIRMASTAFSVMAFGNAALRREYFQTRSRSLLREVRDAGFVIDDDGRRMEILF